MSAGRLSIAYSCVRDPHHVSKMVKGRQSDPLLPSPSGGSSYERVSLLPRLSKEIGYPLLLRELQEVHRFVLIRVLLLLFISEPTLLLLG